MNYLANKIFYIYYMIFIIIINFYLKYFLIWMQYDIEKIIVVFRNINRYYLIN